MTEPSREDRIRWQDDAILALRGLLTLALRDSLPALTWTIDTKAVGLVGRATTRHEWDMWQAAITQWSSQEAVITQEPASDEGVIHLAVRWDRYPHPENVIIIADISG